MATRKAARVLFLVPYPEGKAPSQRFRVEMLLPLLKQSGLVYQVRPFMDEELHSIFYKKGRFLQKILGIGRGFLRRTYTVLFEAPHYDRIFIHREAAPLGPPLFEWILCRVFRKTLIYDFDDAIWIPDDSVGNNSFRLLKATWKVKHICKWASLISAGNEYLMNYAKQHTKGTTVHIPTVVDTINRYRAVKEHTSDIPVLGWTGSHSTLKYLELIMPVLKKLQEELEFKVLIIADRQPELDLRNWEFISWNAETEIRDLLKIDIGLMPLPPDPWAEGKCGFKIIQYLSLGIPAVASDVGVNSRIVENGVNGYLSKSEEDWIFALRTLVGAREMRRMAGISGKRTIEKHYSVNSVSESFIGLFQTPL